MRITYNQPTKKLNWIKWGLIILSLIIVTCFIYGVVLYNTIEKNKTAGFDETKEWVTQDTDITTVSSIERYHGKEAYHIVYGQTDDEIDKIVFVPLQINKDEEKKELIVVDLADIMSKKAIQDQWQQQCNNCNLTKIVPGVEDDQLLWELTYVDDANRHVLEYVSIYDGSQYEQFRFTQRYQ